MGSSRPTSASVRESVRELNTAGDVWDSGIHGCLQGSYAEGTVAGDSALLDAARKATSYLKLTANRVPTVAVAVEALTAGVMDIYITYVS